jgi:uncharacterized membrane protein YfcA
LVTIVLAALTALVAACLQATTGIGFALVLTPVMFGLLSPTSAIVTSTALGLALNLLVLLGERRRPEIAWPELRPILLAAVPGTACGVLLLRALPKPVLQISVGVAVIAAVALRARAGRAFAGAGGSTARLALGFATGAMTTSTGVSGPPVALWLARRGLRPGEIRDSLSAMFLAIGLIALVALTPVIGQAHLDPSLLVAATACVIVGHALGKQAFARLDARRFEPLLLAVILCAGAVSIVSGASAL